MNRPECLEILIKCMERVVDESPPAFKETAKMELDLLKSYHKSTGLIPETFMAMSNRGGGKTYPFTKAMMWAAMKYDLKIGLLCRTKNQLGSYWNGVFDGPISDIWNEWQCKEKICGELYSEVIIECEEERKNIGYVLPLNSAYGLKNHSSKLRDIDIMFMDEFQSPDSIPGEMDKYDTMHMTIARGGPEGVRYLPTILCSNSLSITNIYMAFFGLCDKIQSNTKMYRGEGISLLRFRNDVVADKQMSTGYYRSKVKTKQAESDIDNAWLNDDGACVAKPDGWGIGWYQCTIVNGTEKYGVYYYPDMDYYYVGRNVDSTCKSVYAVRPGGVENTALLKRASVFDTMRKYFASGQVRFCDQTMKNNMVDILYKRWAL